MYRLKRVFLFRGRSTCNCEDPTAFLLMQWKSMLQFNRRVTAAEAI
ncbi:hypothetical protein RJ641_009264 [Dillenia turbinata]|uniref:Uncharacterized protein n=1 Tax=Dillenia turbinata TaxID=194707 RepID=A0AAN8UXR6_9MAGN